MTAEEFKNKNALLFLSNPEKIMVEFAKHHVKQALEAANKNAKIIDDPNSYTGNTGSEYPADQIIDKNSILNAYPENNII
jgi:hypothetical protein